MRWSGPVPSGFGCWWLGEGLHQSRRGAEVSRRETKRIIKRPSLPRNRATAVYFSRMVVCESDKGSVRPSRFRRKAIPRYAVLPTLLGSSLAWGFHMNRIIAVVALFAAVSFAAYGFSRAPNPGPKRPYASSTARGL